MDKITEQLEALNAMVLDGKVLEAFEKYYADEITLQENEEEIFEGKEACLEKEKRFVNGITEFRSAKAEIVAVFDDISAVKWFYDYTHKEFGTRTYTQLSIQRWNSNGKIVNEKFYYSR